MKIYLVLGVDCDTLQSFSFTAVYQAFVSKAAAEQFATAFNAMLANTRQLACFWRAVVARENSDSTLLRQRYHAMQPNASESPWVAYDAARLAKIYQVTGLSDAALLTAWPNISYHDQLSVGSQEYIRLHDFVVNELVAQDAAQFRLLDGDYDKASLAAVLLDEPELDQLVVKEMDLVI